MLSDFLRSQKIIIYLSTGTSLENKNKLSFYSLRLKSRFKNLPTIASLGYASQLAYRSLNSVVNTSLLQVPYYVLHVKVLPCISYSPI